MQPQYRLTLLKIPVTRVDQAVTFYQDVLGMEVTFVAEEYGWAQLQAGDLPLALYEPGKGGGQRPVGGSVDFHLALAGPEFDAWAARWQEQGVLDGGQIHRGADGSVFVDIRDPDGNVLKVMRQAPTESGS